MAEMHKNPFFQIITAQHIFVWLTHVRCKHSSVHFLALRKCQARYISSISNISIQCQMKVWKHIQHRISFGLNDTSMIMTTVTSKEDLQLNVASSIVWKPGNLYIHKVFTSKSATLKRI
jgi:hypothetical protein